MIQFDPGIMIWTTIIFTLLLIILKKFAWKPILNSVDERNKSIEKALSAAEKAKEEMALLQTDNERILSEAKTQREELLKEARTMKNEIITEAKTQANKEAEKILNSAKDQIANEKMKALVELKNEIANLSIQMAEKILRSELTDVSKQKELIEKTLKNKDLN